MILSTQLFDRIVGVSKPDGADPTRPPTILPVGCRRSAERREATRLAFGQRSQICPDGGKRAGVWETVMLQDISVKGIGYICHDPMSFGETFVLKLTDKEGETIRIRCKVHRCERGGFGNTAYLVGSTFEAVIQKQIFRVNDDEHDATTAWGSTAEPQTAGAPVLTQARPKQSSRMVGMAVTLLRAIDPFNVASHWSKKEDDFGAVG